MGTICRLCCKERELKESHIIPKFVGRWLKKNGSTGKLTAATADPSSGERSQDIYKIYLLCSVCEGLFSGFETHFSNNIFRPFQNGTLSCIPQSEHIAKLVVSVSLRALWVFQNEDEPLIRKYSTEIRLLEEEWKQFVQDTEGFQKGVGTHHLFLADHQFLAKGLTEAPNLIINTYRSSIFEIVEVMGVAFFYINMAGVQIISMISQSELPETLGTQVYPCQEFGLQGADINWVGYYAWMINYSNRADATRVGLPQNEKEKIYRAEEKNPERSENSDDARIYRIQEAYKRELG